MFVQFIVFLTLLTRGTDILKCFSESLGIRDNESRLYFVNQNKMFSFKIKHQAIIVFLSDVERKVDENSYKFRAISSAKSFAPFLKKSLLYKERICFQTEQNLFLLNGVDPFSEGLGVQYSKYEKKR